MPPATTRAHNDNCWKRKEVEKKRTGTVEMQTLSDGKEDMPLLDQNNHGSHAPLTATHDVHEVPVGSGWLRCLKKLLQGFGELFRDIYCLSASDERRAFVTVMLEQSVLGIDLARCNFLLT